MKPDPSRRALILAALLSPAAHAGAVLGRAEIRAAEPLGPVDAIRYLMREVLVSPQQRSTWNHDPGSPIPRVS